MKYILLLAILSYSHIVFAAADETELRRKGCISVDQKELLGFFPDGITPAALARSDSGSTADTEPTETESKDTHKALDDLSSIGTGETDLVDDKTIGAASGAGESLEDRAKRRLAERKEIRARVYNFKSKLIALSKRKSRGRRKPAKRFPSSAYQSTVPPIARTWADVSDAEKERLGLLVKEEPLSRTEAYKQSFPMSPMPDTGHLFPTDEGRPIAECFGAYRDYYRAHPTDDKRITVYWPPSAKYDGKAPGWYWGVTGSGDTFLYFGGENVVDAAIRAFKIRPRAETPA